MKAERMKLKNIRRNKPNEVNRIPDRYKAIIMDHSRKLGQEMKETSSDKYNFKKEWS